MSNTQSLQEAWGDPVDITDFLRDEPGGGFYLNSMGNATQIYDRDDGRYRPIYDNEIDLKVLRAQSWLMVEKVPMAGAWVNRLLDYTVGTGFDWSVDSENKELAALAKSILDKCLLDNKWSSELERESFVREIVDGEFQAGLEWHSGSVEIATRECDELTEPANARELEDYFDIDYEGPLSWTFGVCSPRYKSYRPLGFHVVHDQAGNDWDYFQESSFVHWKRNVRRGAKRGVGDFYRPSIYLMRSDRVAGNVGDSAAIQAAIAYIVEHSQGTTGTQAQKLTANALQTGRVDPINGTMERLLKAKVSRLDVRNGQKYTNGPMGQNNAPIYIEVIESLLRMAGTVHAFPEGMLTGSYANNNLASALVAQSPFVQGRVSEQLERAAKTKSMFGKILGIYADKGAFSRHGIDSAEELLAAIKVNISPSKVIPQDPLVATQALALQKGNGWVDDKTAITELGRDAEVVTDAIRKQGKTPSVPTLGQVVNGLSDKQEAITEAIDEHELSPAQQALLESWKDYP